MIWDWLVGNVPIPADVGGLLVGFPLCGILCHMILTAAWIGLEPDDKER